MTDLKYCLIALIAIGAIVSVFAVWLGVGWWLSNLIANAFGSSPEKVRAIHLGLFMLFVLISGWGGCSSSGRSRWIK